MLPSNIIAILPPELIKEERPFFGSVKMPDEIRLRAALGSEFISENKLYRCKYIPSINDIRSILNLAAGQSLFSHEKELSSGYITISGGHRIGFTGRVSEGKDKTFTDNFSSLNIRIAREVSGCSGEIIKAITSYGYVHSSIIASPPGVGKTTLLRDIAKKLSDGTSGIKSVKVAIVDERDEIAAVQNGIAQLDVGRRTDVASGCKKSTGINMMIRSMSPEVIITDEIGGKEDFDAVLNASRSGVKVITTAHAYDINDLKNKYHLHDLLLSAMFELYIFPKRINNMFKEYKAYSADFTEIHI